jgi:glucokinase
VFYMTWSTGIGAGIVLDGRIYHGKNGAAAEGGHVTVDYRAPSPCNCGVPGCIEGLASGSAIAARASRLLGRTLTAEEVGRAALEGDAIAARVIDESVEMVAAWLGSMISVLDPDIVVIGGGVAQLGEPVFAKLRAETPRRTINQFAVDTPIVPAALAGHVGILGAASVVL